MIKLKYVIHHQDNSIEAAWVDEIIPAVEVPEIISPDHQDIYGNVIHGEITPSHTIPAVEIQVKCHSYADVQMDMFEADLGSDVSRFTELIANVRAAIVPAPAPIPLSITECLKKIDSDTDGIYGAILGNRSEEYSLAAAEANAYKNSGYTGIVPGSVQSWASAKGWTATQATDDILATGTQWIGAQAIIRATRLARKEQCRVATPDATRLTIMADWAAFVLTVRGQLGIS